MPKPLSRRTLLRSAGAIVSLPYLEAMLPKGAWSAPAAPVRLVWVYVPNGVNVGEWRYGGEMENPRRAKASEIQDDVLVERELDVLPPSLRSLAPFRSRLSIHQNLTAHHARANGDGPGDHARAAAAWLTGVQPLKDDGQVQLGISADQLAAQRIGDATLFRSLVLGTESPRLSGQCDSGYACAYQSHLSWEGPTTPASKETRPSRAFDRLFRGDGQGLPSEVAEDRRARRRSVLDLVRDDAKRLSAQLAADDRHRLDEYLAGLREVERRIDRAETLAALGVPDEDRPPEAPADLGEHARALLDVARLALTTDATRIVTVMLGNEGSNRAYREVSVNGGHHEISHHGKDAPKMAGIAKIDGYLAAQFGHLLQGLASTPDGETDLLANSLVVYGSGIEDGNRHWHHDLPTLVAGEGGGARPGRVVEHPRETPIADLHLAMLERAGVQLASDESLGDGRAPLAGL
tara:strand:- start:2729 stop:4117 length:1389 start_codon:yes stop_codon:yes gene_type:complete